MNTNIDTFREPFVFDSNSPFRALRNFEREMNQLLDERFSFGPRNWRNLKESFATPSCNIDETGTHYLMTVDLPGVGKDHVDVQVTGNELRITGERREQHKEESKESSYAEREFGKYTRVFTLPTNANPDKLEANYQDGVLRIAIPKLENAKAHKIKIGDTRAGWWERLIEKSEPKKPELAKPAA